MQSIEPILKDAAELPMQNAAVEDAKFREQVRALLLAIKHKGPLSDSPELMQWFGTEFNAVNASMREYDAALANYEARTGEER